MIILNKVYYFITYLVGSTFKKGGENPNSVAFCDNCSVIELMRGGTDNILQLLYFLS